jgi:hypothetical protein
MLIPAFLAVVVFLGGAMTAVQLGVLVQPNPLVTEPDWPDQVRNPNGPLPVLPPVDIPR